MKLKEYLDTNGLKYGAFAKKINVAPGTLWKAMNGKDIYLSVAVKIEKGTNGKVKCMELLDLDNPSEK